MKIFNNNSKEVADISLNIEAIEFEEIFENGEVVLIPYNDKEFLKDVACLVYDTVMTNEPDWMYPDYNNSKLALCINTDSENFNVGLSVEAIPPKYTEEEKNVILSKASKEPILKGSDWNDYENWKEVFESAGKWHSKKNNCGEIYTYLIELQQDEQKLLQLCAQSPLH